MAIAKDGMSESARKELTESRRRIEELTSQLAKLSSEVGSQSLQLSTGLFGQGLGHDSETARPK